MPLCSSKDIQKSALKELASGLEWNDPWHLNVIPQPEDRRKLFLILFKIAQETHLPLMPYFQDYELVSILDKFTLLRSLKLRHFITDNSVTHIYWTLS